MSSNDTDFQSNLLKYTSGTCANKPYPTFIDGMFIKIQDAFFYVNVLQFAIVTLMFVNVGKGRYWRILFYAAVAGFVGVVIENSTVAYMCREAVKDKKFNNVIPFFIAEFCWVVEEYSIPFLNLTKMRAFSRGKLSKVINIFIMGLFPVFVTFRFYIGYNRMKDGVLTTKQTKYGHSLAFAVMAVADITCTFSILYFVKKHNSQEAMKATNNITNYIKRSSYIILICVDIVGVLLAVTNSITEKFPQIPGSIVNPLHCIKCSFILILASDALLFKYGVNTSSNHESSGNYYNYSSNKKSRNYLENTSNISYKSKSQNMSSITPYNYPSLDFNKTNESNNPYQGKSIVKNYTNIKPTTSFDTSPNSDNTYTSPNFGFLYQKDYMK